MTFCKQTTLALLLSPEEAVNSNMSTRSVSHGFSSRCLRVRSIVVYGVSAKLRRFRNRKEETEATIIFLLNWALERWNLDLAKDISRRRQHLKLLCNTNSIVKVK